MMPALDTGLKEFIQKNVHPMAYDENKNPIQFLTSDIIEALNFTEKVDKKYLEVFELALNEGVIVIEI